MNSGGVGLARGPGFRGRRATASLACAHPTPEQAASWDRSNPTLSIFSLFLLPTVILLSAGSLLIVGCRNSHPLFAMPSASRALLGAATLGAISRAAAFSFSYGSATQCDNLDVSWSGEPSTCGSSSESGVNKPTSAAQAGRRRSSCL